MSLAIPQPDFEPTLRRHLSAFHARLEVEPDRFDGPGDEDEDDGPVGDHPTRRTSHLHLLIVNGDRR